MYEVSMLLDGCREQSEECETLEEAMKFLNEWLEEDIQVLTDISRSNLEYGLVTFKIEKKVTLFSITY